MVQMLSPAAELAATSAIVLGSIGMGGGLYETLLVDPKWPSNPAIVQPSRGGIDRARFWGPIVSAGLPSLCRVLASIR